MSVTVVSVMNSSLSFQNVCEWNFVFRKPEKKPSTTFTHLHVIEDHGRMRVILGHVIVTAEGAPQASTTTECAVLQRRGPVGAAPNRWPPKIPSALPVDKLSIKRPTWTQEEISDELIF